MTTDKRSVSSEETDRIEALARREMSDVPPDVAERLSEMRREAVQMVKDDQPFQWVRSWSPLTVSMAGAAFAMVIAVWLVLRPGEGIELPFATEPEVAIVQDMDLLEELEFIAWLEEESQGAG